MTPSERERRIEAAAKALWDRAEKRAFDNTRYPVTPWEGAHDLRAEMREEAALSLDAAEEVVPVVSQRVKDEQQKILDRQFWDMRVALTERAERAEAEVARLRERLSRLEAAARDVLPLLGMGPAQGFSAESYRAKARLALVLDESDSPFSCEEGIEA